MAVIQEVRLDPVADVGDPDDWRPNSRWALLADAEASLAVIIEEVAPADRIPLHRHTIDEVLLYEAGSGEIVLGDERQLVRAGSIAFVPAGVAHATVNTGDEPLRVRAVFPSHVIDIEYLDRNPAPGTDDAPPQPPVTYDARTGHVTTR